MDNRAIDGLGIAVNRHLMAGIDAGVDASGFPHPDQTVVADLGDNQADFIHMTGQQNLEGRVGIQNADHIAGIVGEDFVAAGRHFPDNLFLKADFMPGNGHFVQQGV